MRPNAVGFVFARGGSKGLPRKNLRCLAGKPLIAHAITAGLASRYLQRVVISTDDEEIARVGREYGAEVPFLRPPELATDDSPEWLSWQHALTTLEQLEGQKRLDVFVSLPTTSPLRSPKDIDACVELLVCSDADVVITVTPAARNPYFNMAQIDAQGYVKPVIPSSGQVHGRQQAPVVYDITTVVYAARPAFIRDARGLWNGKVRAIVVPRERAADVDEEIDLEWCEFLLGRKHGEQS